MPQNKNEVLVDKSREDLEGLMRELSPEQRTELARLAIMYLETGDRDAITASGVEDAYDAKTGFTRFPVFSAVVKRWVPVTYEAAAVRQDPGGNGHQILLSQRRSEHGEDPWEGQWHVPGGVIRKTDRFPDATDEETADYADFSSVRSRLIENEFGGAIRLTGNPVAMPTVGREGSRGLEITVRELLPVEFLGKLDLPENMAFYNIRNVLARPPEGGLIGTHRRILLDVANIVGGIRGLNQDRSQLPLF